MEESKISLPPNLRLKIAFPKSSEDHRLQLIEINGAMFAIVHSPLESEGPIRLLCEGWSLILLAPLKSRTNILVSAINVVVLSEISSEEGHVSLHASNRLVKFTQSPQKISQMGERGEFQFNDDLGSLLYYYRSFDRIVNHIREGSPAALSQAEQTLIMSLCALADKMEGKKGNLNLHEVLKIWGIPQIK
jgi:hypothetical protein